jgi:hypothetical protein
MSGPDSHPTPGTEPGKTKPEKLPDKPENPTPPKRSPVFRMARLDGRDTLKYEDTADK